MSDPLLDLFSTIEKRKSTKDKNLTPQNYLKMVKKK